MKVGSILRMYYHVILTPAEYAYWVLKLEPKHGYTLERTEAIYIALDGNAVYERADYYIALQEYYVSTSCDN